ncbi:MAG: Ig-like domain-containing protein [Neisseriaceae bacterium]
MLKSLSKYLISILMLILALSIASCGGGGGGGSVSQPPGNTLISISLSPANKTINIGTTQAYIAYGYYVNGESKDITNQIESWSSSDNSKATMNHNIATAIESGQTTITAYTHTSTGIVAGNTKLIIVPKLTRLNIKNTIRFPYSVGLNESIQATFTVINSESNAQQLSPSISVTPNYGSAIVDNQNSTCKATIAAKSSCNYVITYTSPNDPSISGSLVNINLQINNNIQSSSITFLAGGLVNFTPPQVPYKVLVIYNEDDEHTIYPVIETSRHLVDPANNVNNPDYWLMAYYNQPSKPVLISGVYRIYVGGQNGIPPGGYEVISLPFYNKFKTTESNNDNFIDWWNGVRIYMYDNPSAILNHLGKDDNQLSNNLFDNTIANAWSCSQSQFNQPCSSHAISIYQDKLSASFLNNEPAQLVEYSVGGSTIPPEALRWDVTGVDFDMSYVDNLYLTATLERINYIDPTEGYVGSPYKISELQHMIASSNFMSTTNPPQGIWPEYVFSKDNYDVLQSSPVTSGQIKLPSTHEAISNLYSPILSESLANGLPFFLNRYVNGSWLNQSESIQAIWQFKGKILQAWQNTISSGDGQIVWNAFESNYNINCQGKPPLTLESALQYIIGWVPVAKCMDGSNAGKTPLPMPGPAGSPGEVVIDAYHRLMNTPGQTLNPWVDFIHSQLGMQSTYAYSIDDELGNVFTHGDGFVVNVGGINGLENPNARQKADQTVGFMASAKPTNYFITNANVCGFNVRGRTTEQSPTIPIIPDGGIPIYLSQVGSGKSCSITLDIKDIPHGDNYTVNFIIGDITTSTTQSQILNMIRSTCNSSNPTGGGDNYCSSINVTAPDGQWFASITPSA